MRVVHTTGYDYATPVTSSYNEARLTPRNDNRQNVILSRVETTPSTRSYRYNDYWGTVVTAFDLHAPHTGLEVVGSSVVETDPTTVTENPVGWAELSGERIVDRFTEVLEHSTYVPENLKLTKLARELRAAHEPVAAVRAAGGFVHSEMSYIPGTTGVHSSAIDAWKERSGVCQDYAHLTLLLLRGMGIPSRYVSGYLHPRRNAELGETVQGESHAWVEVWTGSWWGFDPTNGVDVSSQHVTVGMGRDYGDVPPLKGIYSGGGSTALDVVVEITRLA